MVWQKYTLGECCEIVSGATPSTSVDAYWGGEIYWATPKDLSDLTSHYISDTPRKLSDAGLASCAATILPVNSVLFSSRAPIGHVAINTVPMATNQGFKSFIPRRGVMDAKFLFHWLRANRRFLDSLGVGATFKEVSKAIVSKVEIKAPPIEEQRRIAAILDKVDSLRAKRREALVQLDSLAQSIFTDMFGDPVANEKSWVRREFGELLSSIDSGWSPVCLERPVREAEWGVLKLGAVTSCIFDYKANKALPLGLEPDASIEVKAGDLLFSRKNTYELVAACAYVEATPPRLMMPDLIFRLQVRDETVLNKRYLHALLTNARKRIEVQKLAGGSAGSMPNISKAKLLKLEIELPPLSEQCIFSSRVQAVGRAKSVQLTALADAEALFLTLQSRAFRGEL